MMTSDQAFAAAFAIVWKIENGSDAIVATNNPADPGGYTRGGIALARHPELTRSSLDAMTTDDFKAWYRANYWTPNACDQLPWPVSLAVFDGEVNQGSEGGKALQQALGVRVDGKIGPITLAAARAADPIVLCAHIFSLRDAAYRLDLKASIFDKGWTIRLFTVAFSASGTEATGA